MQCPFRIGATLGSHCCLRWKFPPRHMKFSTRRKTAICHATVVDIAIGVGLGTRAADMISSQTQKNVCELFIFPCHTSMFASSWTRKSPRKQAFFNLQNSIGMKCALASPTACTRTRNHRRRASQLSNRISATKCWSVAKHFDRACGSCKMFTSGMVASMMAAI